MPKKKIDQSDWIADPKDVEFDKLFKTIISIILLIPVSLGGIYLWHVI